MNIGRVLMMAAILTTGTAAFSFGQYNGNARPDNRVGVRERDDAVSETKHEEVRKKLNAVRIWKLTEQLKLDADTSVKVSSLLSSMDLKRKDLQREHMEAMKTLRKTVSSARPDQAKIKACLDTIKKNQHALLELRDQEMTGLQSLLTIEQQGRYVLFNQAFRREMRDLIEDARSGKGPRDGGEQGMRDRQQKGAGRQADR